MVELVRARGASDDTRILTGFLCRLTEHMPSFAGLGWAFLLPTGLFVDTAARMSRGFNAGAA